MKTRLIEITGNYDRDKKTKIRVKTNTLLGPHITARAYKAAIKRMGLAGGDFPRLAEDFPCVSVMHPDGRSGYALIS